MGAISVWEVESSNEFEAARGRSPQARLAARHRDVKSRAGIMPEASPYRFCDLTWFPRFIGEGERRQFAIFQVRGIEGMMDGVYGAAAPDAAVKVILQRWFGDVA